MSQNDVKINKQCFEIDPKVTKMVAKIDAKTLQEFVASLPIPEDAQHYLANLTPSTYLGNAESMTIDFLKRRSGNH